MTASPFVNEIISKYVDNEELRQLLIAHSESVAAKALDVATKAGIDGQISRQFVYDAAMLHDIGIVRCDAPSIYCHGKLPYICHGVAGANILEEEGIGEEYQRVCKRHTGAGITHEDIENGQLPLPPGDYIPETLEEKLICYADKFYSKSGTPWQEKSLERVQASMARHGERALERFMDMHRFFCKT